MIVFCTYSRVVWGAERSLLHLIENSSGPSEVLVIHDRNSKFGDSLVAAKVANERFRYAVHPALASGSLATANGIQLAREAASVIFGGFRLARQLWGRRADIEVLVAFSTWQTPEIILAAKILRVPVVVDLHDTFSSERATAVISRTAKAADCVIAPTRLLLDRYGIKKRCSAIPRPVSQVHDVSADSVRMPTVGMFGQFAPHKRVLETVHAFADIQRSDARLIVVGLSESQTDYERDVVKAAALDERVSVLPRVEDVSRIMSECTVVVNASDHEAFGRTLAEGAVHGCVPVGRVNTGGEEIVGNLGAGRVVTDLNDLSREIEGALEDATHIDKRALSLRASELFGAREVAAEYFATLMRAGQS